MTLLGLLVLSYLLGGIPTGAIIARMRGVDLRRMGSGNIGTANVLRALGPGAAIAVFLGDAGKGAGALLLGRYIIGYPWGEVACGLGAISGHIFSPYLRFRGGRGVATSIGALGALSPGVAGIAFGVFFVAVALYRYVSLASLSATFTAFVLLIYRSLARVEAREVAVFALGAAFLIFFQHRENIRRLWQGRELRLGAKPHLPGEGGR